MPDHSSQHSCGYCGDKFDKLLETHMGTVDEQIKASLEREKIRDVCGGKLMQEIFIK